MQTVFHHANREAADHVLANVKHLLDDPTVAMESVVVVANADGVHLLVEGGEHGERVRALAERRGGRFVVCGHSLESRGIHEPDLLGGVDTVVSGVGALTRLQQEVYAYIKD